MKTTQAICSLLLIYFFTLNTPAISATKNSSAYLKTTNILVTDNQTLRSLNPLTNTVNKIQHKVKSKIKKITAKVVKKITDNIHKNINNQFTPSPQAESSFINHGTNPSYSTSLPPPRRYPSKQKPFLNLFKWISSESQISTEWVYMSFNPDYRYAPITLQDSIKKSFLKKSILYFNFQKHIIQFPYILKWGFKSSLGLARNYNVESLYFIPLHFSLILNFQIFQNQFFTPFLEAGYSTWNIDFSKKFSRLFPFWGVGTIISLSLFKPALRYTLLDEYGIKDIGFIFNFKNNFQKHIDKSFLNSLHAGIYFQF